MHFVIKYPFALSDTVESVQDAEIAANTGLLHKPLGSLSSQGNRFISCSRHFTFLYTPPLLFTLLHLYLPHPSH